MTEAESYARYIVSSIDHLLECLTGLDAAGLNWRPAAPDANSLFAMAAHAIENCAENVLGTACGVPMYQGRETEAEFGASSDAVTPLLNRWNQVRADIQTFLPTLSAEELAEERVHPRRGAITTREVLLVAARHAAEHYGQAQLTRDLWLAARV